MTPDGITFRVKGTVYAVTGQEEINLGPYDSEDTAELVVGRIRAVDPRADLRVEPDRRAAPATAVPGAGPTVVRSTDGLTPEEGRVMDALLVAFTAYAELPVDHPSEPHDFFIAMNRLQDLLAVRVARRHYPGWAATS